jgi:peptidoglycan/xylan/chitin deacetylase (PgdA/CDA1 family)
VSAVPGARDDTLVLCYHAVSREWPSALAVSPETLERQLSFLVERGYRGVAFGEAVRGVEGKAVAVTFDDGFRSVIDHGKPILDRLGLQGTIFVPTGFVDRDQPMSWHGIAHWVGSSHEDELLPVGWGDLRRLAGEGWEVGSHTRAHKRLTTLDKEQLDRELRCSREECQSSLGLDCRSLAYPYGEVDQRVTQAALDAGYSDAAMLSSELPTGDPMRWPRVGIFRGDGMRAFRLKVSPSVRRLRGTALWPPLAAPLGRWRRRVGAPS